MPKPTHIPKSDYDELLDVTLDVTEKNFKEYKKLEAKYGLLIEKHKDQSLKLSNTMMGGSIHKKDDIIDLIRQRTNAIKITYTKESLLKEIDIDLN